jgi:hypothetical protein
MMGTSDRIAESRFYDFLRRLTRITIFAIVFLRMNGYAQDSTKAFPDSADIRIYIDSPDYWIDLDYFRREITFVNYVRDRADADVHILTTTQGTGGGGREFTMAFIGLRKFEGQKNNLKFASKPAETEDTIRKELARYFKIGLMPFVSQSPAVKRIDVTYQPPAEEKEKSKSVRDPWNYWTFRASIRGYINGEKTYKYNSFNSTFSANRVTDAWKFNLYFSIAHTRTEYDYGEALSYADVTRSNYGSGSVVKSLTRHWSLGIETSAYKSTYNNYDLSASIAPGIEFNVFPYSESTRKQFTFQYLVAANHYDYHEETIYLKNIERRLTEKLNVTYEAKQPWGSIRTSLYGSHFIDDMKKYNVQWDNSIDLRLFKGFSLTCYGYMTFLRDQISLPRSGATLEEILLRRRELQTSYYYYLSVGFSYTFGSIYNNIVNPRFGGL